MKIVIFIIFILIFIAQSFSTILKTDIKEKQTENQKNKFYNELIEEELHVDTKSLSALRKMIEELDLKLKKISLEPLGGKKGLNKMNYGKIMSETSSKYKIRDSLIDTTPHGNDSKYKGKGSVSFGIYLKRASLFLLVLILAFTFSFPLMNQLEFFLRDVTKAQYKISDESIQARLMWLAKHHYSTDKTFHYSSEKTTETSTASKREDKNKVDHNAVMFQHQKGQHNFEEFTSKGYGVSSQKILRNNIHQTNSRQYPYNDLYKSEYNRDMSTAAFNFNNINEGSSNKSRDFNWNFYLDKTKNTSKSHDHDHHNINFIRNDYKKPWSLYIRYNLLKIIYVFSGTTLLISGLLVALWIIEIDFIVLMASLGFAAFWAMMHLSDFIRNFAAYIWMIYNDSINLGDIIQINSAGVVGVVTKIDILTTTFKGFQNTKMPKLEVVDIIVANNYFFLPYIIFRGYIDGTNIEESNL